LELNSQIQLKQRNARKQNSSVRLAELAETNIALAVSGGSDSMAMLRLALEQFSEKSITVLTVDHGLRAAAADEARQVASWCAGFGVPHVILKWESLKPKTGIQAKARKARYDLMSAWCLQKNVPVLMTAHNADDQTETVYMRKTRTNSAKSLAGIWPARDWNGIRIVRPVLAFSRTDLRSYLSSIKQDWIDDPSNDDETFERVRIRKLLTSLDVNFGESAKIAQSEVMRDQCAADDWASQYLSVHELGFVTFDRASFDQLKLQVQDFVLLRILRLCGSVHDSELKERLGILAWFKVPSSSRRVLGGALFMKRAKQIIVGREAGRISPEPVIMPKTGELIWDGRFRVKGPVGVQVVAGLYGPKCSRDPEIPAFIQAGLPVLVKNTVVLPISHKLEFLRQ
jgi:tRNA(Ile)-lysidine synthase